MGVRVDHPPAACGSLGNSGSIGGHALDPAGAEPAPARASSGAPSAASSRSALAGQVRPQQHRHRPQPLGEAAQHRVELLAGALVLRQPPRRPLLDVAVQPAHALPDLLERERQLGAVDVRGDALAQAREVLGQRRLRRSARHLPVAVAPDHPDRAAGEVAELVGELGLVAQLEGRGGDRAVLPEGHLAQQVEAQRVGAEALDHRERVEHVAQRLAHLLAVHQQVAVHEDVLGQLELGGHQQRGPVDGVEAQDVLRDQVVARGPQLAA